MSLYEGLEDDKDKGDSKADLSGWGSMHKMLAIQKQLQAKSKASQMQPKKRGTTMAPVVNLRSRDRDRNINTGGELYFNQQTGRLETVGGGGVPTGGTPFIASEAPLASLLGVSDEYDPLRPNDYEDFVKKRKEQKKREEEEKRREKERERDERRRTDRDRGGDSDEEFENRRRSKRSRDSDEEEERESRSRRSAGAAIAPPTSLLEEDRFSPERESVEIIEGTDSPPTFQAPGITGASFGMAGSVAAKIMEKLGYKEGSGLGKNQQGMSMALQVEKTSKRGGKIIHEKDILKMEAERPKPEAMTNANLLKNPSKVILLRNMVGPGDVDDDLEPETAEECGKYGKVVKCIIFEIPDEKDPEEAVRIFVEFERMEAAIKAVVDLNGRYFGGRMVKACFYNLDKFRRLDLVDDPN